MGSKQLYRTLACLSGYIVSGLVLMVSAQALAKPNSYYGSISALSGVSDNGLKTEEETISEKQSEYALNLGGEWVNSLLLFNMGYSATQQTFAKDSQEDSSFLEGKSSLLLGKEQQPVNLALTHSRTTLLNSPDSLNLTQNQDEKEVFSAKPTLRQRISGVDSLLLNGEYTRINYLENELKNSRREGGSLVLDHKFSTLDNLQLSAQQTLIDFKYAPDANYKLSAAALNYNVQLRKVSYSATVGVNKTAPDIGEDYSSPSYEVNFRYNAGAQALLLSGSRGLSDTSAGGGEALPSNDLPTSDGGVANLDQIERTSYGVIWTIFSPCQGCSFVLGANQFNDDYLNMNASAKERSWNAGFNYAFSPAAKISLRYADGNNTYTHIIIGQDYKIKTARIEYSYQLNRDFDLSCQLRKEQRDGDASGVDYAESYAGAGLRYGF